MSGSDPDRDGHHVALFPEELSDEAVEAIRAAMPGPESIANDGYLDEAPV